MRELSNCLWIPVKEFGQELRRTLTVSVYGMDGETTEVECFRTDRRGYIGIPRVFGLKSISGEYEDRRVHGGKVWLFPKAISLRPEQVALVADMVTAAEDEGDFITHAAAGKGKTVCALATIQRLGRRAVVIVDQQNLLDQWVERCVEHLGLSKEDIGIVQGPNASYRDKPITICMMQTLVRKDLPDSFFEYFGIVVFDESHSAGAPTFSRALMMFSARIRFGLSATPDRRDAMKKAIAWNLGDISASLKDKHEKSLLYIVQNETVYSWRVNNSKMVGGFINEVASDSTRNLRIAHAAKWLYDSGRDVLVIGDRVEHLSSLMALCEAVGIPAEDMGLYAKQRTVVRYEKHPRPPRRPRHLEKDAEYTPVRLALVQKTVPKKQLPPVLEKARIVFATYQIFSKGVDVPRLSAGIDATPRSEATQTFGRVLRIQDGKLRPIWVTFEDVNSFRSLYQLSGRLKDYINSNAEVYQWDMEKGRRLLDVAEYRHYLKERVALLRKSQIIMSADGHNTLVIPSTQTVNENFLGRRTARISR